MKITLGLTAPRSRAQVNNVLERPLVSMATALKG